MATTILTDTGTTTPTEGTVRVRSTNCLLALILLPKICIVVYFLSGFKTTQLSGHHDSHGHGHDSHGHGHESHGHGHDSHESHGAI